MLVCVLGGVPWPVTEFSQPPSPNLPGWDKLFARGHPSPWLLMWVVEECERNFSRVSPLWFGGGVGIVLRCSDASDYFFDASDLSRVPWPVAKFSQSPSPQRPWWARRQRCIIQKIRGRGHICFNVWISKHTI